MKKTKFTHLLQPFSHFTDSFLWQFSLGVTLFFSVLAVFFKARFDGVLDTHFVESVQWYEPLLDNLINTFSLTLLLGVEAKIMKSNARWQDLLVTSLWSRMAFYPLILFNINDWMRLSTENLVYQIMQNPQALPDLSYSVLAIIFIFSLLALATIALFGWYLWHGFTISTNRKGWKVAINLVVIVFLAEVLSKVLFVLIN